MPDNKQNTSPQSDKAELLPLLTAIRARDEQALAQLYEMTVDRAYSLAHAMTGNDADAEEIVCDLYLQVWQRAEQYDEQRGSVSAWLLINCRSLALDLLRRRKAHRSKQDKFGLQGLVEEAPLIEDLLNCLQEGTAVHKALTELSEIQRKLIALAFFKDMSHPEIASATDLPLGTVKSHIRRGLLKLRQLLDLDS